MSDVRMRLNKKQRARWLEETLRDILKGEKPPVDLNNENEKWLYDQLLGMHKAGMLSAEPESYIFLTPEEDPKNEELRKFKGITDIEALPKALTTQANEIGAQLAEHDIKNYKVLGLDHNYLYSKDSLEQAGDADAFILPTAGIASLYQMVRFINARNDGEPSVQNKHFIIQNNNGFWSPALNFLKVGRNDPNFVVTRTRHETAQTMLSLMPETLREKEPKPVQHRHAMQMGDTLFVITGNTKKPIDYRKVFNERAAGIDVKHFQQVFSKRPHGASEESYTYIGNLLEKYREFYELIRDTYGTENFLAELEEKGYDLDKAFVLFDDSGLATLENLTAGPEFGNTTKVRRNPYSKHGPGPELKGILGAIQNQPYKGKTGSRGLFERMKDSAHRISKERGSESEDDLRASLRAFDEISSIVLPLKEFIEAIDQGLTPEEIAHSDIVYFFSAKTDNSIVFEPTPDQIAVDSKNFMVPRHDPLQRTMAENPNYVARHSVTAQVVKTIMRTMDIERGSVELGPLAQRFNSERESQLKLATHRSILEDDATLEIPGTHYQIEDNKAGLFSLSEPRLHDVENENGEIIQVESALNNFASMCSQVDGFVFLEDDDEMSGNDFFWERNFIAYSIHVGNQIADKTIAGKPSVFINDNTWDEHLHTFRGFCGGLIPELPDYLCKIVDNEDELTDALKRGFVNYSPHELPTYQFREGGQRADDDLYNVTIYSSATSTDATLKASAHEFTFETAAMGFAVMNGGGEGPDGLMHETSDGVHFMRDKFAPYLQKYGIDAPKTHIASIQCEDTAQEEGMRQDNDYWAVWPNIFLRMQDLQKTDAEVVLPGGAGTLQEVCASILMRKYGLAETENRPLIIVNKNGVYDRFLDTIPADDKERFNMHVVEEEEEALDILIEARRNKGMEPELPYTLDEMRDIKNAFDLSENAPKHIGKPRMK